MKEDFLFNDDKDRGKGIDRIGDKSDGLKLKWAWGNKKPSQVCSAELGYFSFEVVYWYTTYEARLVYLDGTLISKGDDEKEDYIFTRLDAQKVAESLIFEHLKYTTKLIYSLK